MTNVNFVANGIFYVQASYPLTDAAACSSDETQQCFVGVDMATGDVKSTVGPNAFEVRV